MKSSDKSKRPVRVGMISLGCAKNLVDAEIMLGSLLKNGMEITNDAAQADVVIVNTCSFIDSAQEESVDTILESAEVREANNRGQGLIVSGCLPQRFREELPRLLPEVDAFMGIDQVAQVTQIVRQTLQRREARLKESVSASQPRHRAESKTGNAGQNKDKAAVVGKLAELDAARGRTDGAIDADIDAHDEITKSNAPSAPSPPGDSLAGSALFSVNARPNYIPDYATPRFRLTPRHFAYLKIAEGCNHPCSFCIIPRMRGSHRSRRQDDIVAEARALIVDGVKELNLISQDSTYYGLDLRQNHSRAIAAPDRFDAAVKSLPTEASTICSLI